MFKPKYNYTNKIVKNIAMISEARTLILNAPLIPKWEVSLRRDALIKSAHSSTAIEGNRLSLEEVSALAEGRDLMLRRKDKQEVLNYLEALDKIPDFTKIISLDTDDLLKIHKIVTQDTLDDPKDEGVFRNRQVYVINRATGQVVFTPPMTGDVPELVNKLLQWFNSKEVEEINPVIEAGIAHYEMVRIHPFIDGNGRTARVFATLILFKRQFDVKRFFALDDYYDQDRRAYYEALNKVDQQTLDLTGWLEYFTEGVAVSLKTVKDKVIGLSKDIKILKDRGQLALTKRQTEIVEKLIQKDSIAISDVSEMFKMSRQAALKEINKLVTLKVVKLKGKGRGAHYVLV
jgi:Fic family protein